MFSSKSERGLAHINGDEYVHDDVDEEMKDIEVVDIGKDDEEINDAEKAEVEKTEEVKGDNKKAELPPTSSSLSDTADVEINSLLDVQIQQEVPHIQSPSILIVPVLVIPKPIVLLPIPEIPLVTPATTLLPPPSVTNLSPVLQQQTTLIPTPLITTAALATTTVPDPLPRIIQRVSELEKDVQELKQVDHSPAILATMRFQVPTAIDEYLGSSLRDTLQKIKQEQAAKEKMPKFLATPYDQVDEAEFKQKEILFKMMRESKSYEKHLKHKELYDALVLSLIQDEDDLDRVIPYLRKRDREEDKDPYARSNQGKRKRSSGKDSKPSKTSSASKETPKGDEEPVQENVNDVDQPKADSEPQTDNAPKKNWFKQSLRPPTPDLEWNKCQDPLTFDELMATPINFSNFAKNRLKLDKITKAYLENPKGDRCLFDLRKPLPLKGHPGHLTAAAEYFFHNDLEYLKSTDSERKYTTSITKTKAARYLEEIVVRRANRQLYKFKECDFVNLHLNDIEDMLLLKPHHQEESRRCPIGCGELPEEAQHHRASKGLSWNLCQITIERSRKFVTLFTTGYSIFDLATTNTFLKENGQTRIRDDDASTSEWYLSIHNDDGNPSRANIKQALCFPKSSSVVYGGEGVEPQEEKRGKNLSFDDDDVLGVLSLDSRFNAMKATKMVMETKEVKAQDKGKVATIAEKKVTPLVSVQTQKNKAFVGIAWSDSEDGDEPQNDATCLMAIDSQEVQPKPSIYNNDLDIIDLQKENEELLR
ncbi:hypothetical protein Tco_0058516, partial [Tanacetum coccineum]